MRGQIAGAGDKTNYFIAVPSCCRAYGDLAAKWIDYDLYIALILDMPANIAGGDIADDKLVERERVELSVL